MTKYLYLLVLGALLASGCARAQAAKTTPDGPPLDVPAPPPRDVETTETEPPPPATLVQEPARNAPPRPRPAPTREQPRAEQPRPEPPKVDTPPIVEPPPRTEEAPRPAPLQTMPPAAEGEAERSIRAALARANTDLGRIDYRLLNKDARTQYDQAKRFVSQADEALRTKNLVYAKNLADKAATIAAQLAGR